MSMLKKIEIVDEFQFSPTQKAILVKAYYWFNKPIHTTFIGQENMINLVAMIFHPTGFQVLVDNEVCQKVNLPFGKEWVKKFFEVTK